MKIVIPISSPRRVIQIIVIVVLCLTLAGIVASFICGIHIHNNYLLTEAIESFVRLFTLHGEGNIPTWYASSTLLLCAILLASITIDKRMNNGRYVYHWGALSLIFLYLSVDEAAMLHEMAIKPMRSLFSTSGLFYYAWIIPGSIAIFGFVLAYLTFLVHLPKKTRLLFIAAGAIYVVGAIGLESVSGLHINADGTWGITYELITIFEELFEMLGIVIFIYTLLDYIGMASVAFTAGDD